MRVYAGILAKGILMLSSCWVTKLILVVLWTTLFPRDLEIYGMLTYHNVSQLLSETPRMRVAIAFYLGPS